MTGKARYRLVYHSIYQLRVGRYSTIITPTPIANMAAPARKRGFSVVTVAKANSSVFMCSIDSSELARKEFASEAEVKESLEKIYSYFRDMPDNCCVPLCHKSGYSYGGFAELPQGTLPREILTRRKLLDLIKPQFSEVGSNARTDENSTYQAFLRYVQEAATGLENLSLLATSFSLLLELMRNHFWVSLFHLPYSFLSLKAADTADIFRTHSLPDILVSDNSAQFIAREFEQFCLNNGILHRTETN